MTHPLAQCLIDAIEASGFTAAGPTDLRAAEHGEPAWVCRAREALAGATPMAQVGESYVFFLRGPAPSERWPAGTKLYA